MPSSSPRSPIQNPHPNPWYAVNLSLVFPGVGNLYGGQWARGLLWSGLGIGLLGMTLWSFFGASGNVQVGAGCLGMGIVLWVFSIIDAYSCLSASPKQAFRSFAAHSDQDNTAKDMWFAVFLSQLLPGLGHLYANCLVAGAFLLGLSILWFSAAILFGPALIGVGVLLALSCAQLAWQLSFTPGPLASSSPPPQDSTSPQETTRVNGLPIMQLSPSPERTRRIVSQGFMLALLILLSRSLMFGSIALAERWVEPFVVPSESMAPTLQVGDRILVSKSARYRPQAGDIVVFRSNYSMNDEGKIETLPESQFFVKRIVATPGDQLEVDQGKAIINGLTRTESYLAEPIAYKLAPQTLEPGQYFVLGDNRNASFDSHIWGALPRENIVGRAYRISWPPERNQPLPRARTQRTI